MGGDTDKDGGVRERISFAVDPSKTAWSIVHEILQQASAAGKHGPVAQHLVGARLQRRFPNLYVENHSFSTSDVQHGRAGDFLLADTVFHVTVSPTPGVFEKCLANLRGGLRVYLIVPDRNLEGARQNAELTRAGSISVDSFEAFIGRNLDEMAVYSRDSMLRRLRELIQLYNQRVDAAEMDKSMLIELPRALIPG